MSDIDPYEGLGNEGFLHALDLLERAGYQDDHPRRNYVHDGRLQSHPGLWKGLGLLVAGAVVTYFAFFHDWKSTFSPNESPGSALEQTLDLENQNSTRELGK